MYRRITKSMFTAVLCLSLVCGLCLPAQAAVVTTSEQDYRNQIIKVCGIWDLSNLGNLMNRADFAKMLVMSSSQRDLLGSSNVAAASDIPANHAYAKYIRAALKNGWMRNRLNGKFDPLDGVSLNDAAKAVMTMLGYSDSDFEGNVSEGRLAKFNALKLNEGVNAVGANELLTVQETVNIIYNALKTNPKQGNSILGTAINLTLAADGSLNATNVLDNTMKGPILIKTYDEIQKNLPFNMSEGTFYYNGAKTSIYQNLQLLYYSSQLNNCGWLIIYYNEASKTVWAYGQDTGNNAYHCIRGTVNTIYYDSDNIVSPSSVVVDDRQYSLGSSDAKFMFSVNGTISVGDEVILICRQNTTNEGTEQEMSSYIVTGVMLYRKKG